jgi:small nuclear ribonucleoprotein (snRNP)-like protein
MHLAELEKSLGKQIRVVISDGRVIEGEFQVHLLGCLNIQLRSSVCKLPVSRQSNLKYLTFHLAVL